jgi:hypothetical protein
MDAERETNRPDPQLERRRAAAGVQTARELVAAAARAVDRADDVIVRARALRLEARLIRRVLPP